MADIIQLLPDAIANQIAAGEVIQRPASVVKELLENAIDAGSTKIQLIIKDAGRTLIQIIDNGCGMSETDARMSFERHATSKIRKAQDLFAIRTMGFRGEALASIAAVAQVEMKTRQQINDTGVRLQIEGSKIIKQEACQAPTGTSIAVKNLFYNIPARRNFLKTDTVEFKHILDEFQRVALANPDIMLSLHRDKEEMFHLLPSNLRQRIVAIYGSSINKKLIPVTEETDIVKIKGYIGKPEFATKTRGKQFFFVNDRFIKSAYLNHAVMSAYDELINKDNYPLYIIFVEIDPAKIDINVHPTKQEIKFDEERVVYNYLKVAIRHALGQHNAMPRLDFDQESTFNLPTIGQSRGTSITETIPSSFSRSSDKKLDLPNAFPSMSNREKNNLQNWNKLYENLGKEGEDEIINPEVPIAAPITLESNWSEGDHKEKEAASQSRKAPYQIHRTYILNQIKSGFILIDQQAAHERILYEQYLDKLNKQESFTQHQLFSTTLEFSVQDTQIFTDILQQVQLLGFDIEPFGKNTFLINGIPAEMVDKQDAKEVILELIENYKFGLDLKLDINENLARAMAKSAAIKKGQKLTVEEMHNLIDKLFACTIPYKSPSGRNCIHTFELEELVKLFDA